MKRDEEGHRGHVGGLFDSIFLMAAPYDPTHPSDHHSQLHPSPIFILTLTNRFPYQPLPFRSPPPPPSTQQQQQQPPPPTTTTVSSS